MGSRRIKFLIAACALAGLIWFRAGVPWLEQTVHRRLEDWLSKSFKHPAKVGAVDVHPFLFSVSISDVRVEGEEAAPLFACEKWVLRPVPFSIRPTFPWLIPSLGASFVQSPTLDLRGMPKKENTPGFWSALKPLWLRHRLRWIHGNLHVPPRGKIPEISLKNTDGEIQIFPDGLRMNVVGTSPVGKLTVDARVAVPGRWSVRAELKEAPLAAFAALYPPQAGRWTGKGAFVLDAQGPRINVPQEGLTWSVKGSIQDGIWQSGRMPVPVSGGFEIDRERFEAKSLRLFNEIGIEGKCVRPFGADRELDFKLRGSEISLEKMQKSMPAAWGGFPVRGKGRIEATIAGPPQAANIDLKAFFENISAAGMTIPRLEVSVHRSPAGLEAQMSLLDGRVTLQQSTTVLKTTDNLWKMRMSKLNLAKLLPPNRWGTIGGQLSGQGRIMTVVPDTELSSGLLFDGLLRVDKAEWGLHRETHPVIGHFSYSNGRFLAKGEQNNFQADIKFDPERTEISELSFRLPSGLSVRTTGLVEGPDKRLAMQVALKKAPLKNVPFLIRRYPGIGGTFDFEGKLHGTSSSPIFEGRLALDNLQAKRDGPVRDAQLDVRWSPDDVSAASVSIGQEWTGSLRWDPDELLAIEMTADNAEMGFISDLFILPAAEGKVRGRIAFSSGDAGGSLKGDGRLLWTNGRWGTVQFREARAELGMSEGNLRIKDWEVLQASGSWQASGDFKPGTPALWNLRSQFKAFSLGRLTLDGEVDASGTAKAGPFSLEGKLNAPALWVNGYGLGSAAASVAYAQRRLEFSRGRIGPDITGHAHFDLGLKTMAGKWTVKNARLSEWAPRFGIDHPAFLSGKTDATLQWDGKWSSPSVRFQGNWSEAVWKKLPFDAAFSGTYRDGTVELKSAKVRATGGEIETNGTISWRDPDDQSGESAKPGGASERRKAAYDLTMTLKGLLASRTLGLLGFGSKAEGSFDGQLRWRGTMSDPAIDGTLSGSALALGKARIAEWSADLKYKNRELRLERLLAKTSEGTWTMKSGSRLFLTGPREGHLQLINELRNIHIGPLSFFGGLEVVGQRRADSNVLGEFSLRAHSLWINQHRFDHDLARVLVSKDKIVFNPAEGAHQQIAGTVHLDQWPQVRLEELTFREGNKDRLRIHGEVGPQKWDFELQGWDLNAQTLLSLADWGVPMEGLLDVHLRGQGSPREPHVKGRIHGKSGTLGRLPYDRFQTDVLWKGPLVEISALEAVRKDGYVIRGEGRLPLNEDAPLENLALHLRLTNGNLNVLKDIWADCRSASGDFRGELQIVPRGGETQMSGFLVVEDGKVRAQKYFEELTDLNARVLVQDNRLVFENLSGRFGEGRLLVQGDLGLDGFDISAYNLSIESVGSKGIEIQIPQLSIPPGPLLKRFSLLRKSLEGISEGSPLVYLKVTGPDGQQTVQGTVVLEDTQMTYPPPAKSLRAVPENSAWREFYRESNWDLVFKTGDDTWYRNEFVSVKVKGSIRVYGQAGAMRADGRIESRQGVITYLGQAFRVKRTLFEVITDTRTVLAGGSFVIPYLSGEAERVAPTIDARGFATPDTILMVVDRAPIGEIQPRFISRNNPSLSSDRVAQMALGLSAEEFTPDEKDKLLRAGLVQLLGSTAGPLASRIAHRFGIDILYPIYEPNEPDYVPPGQRPSVAQRREAQSLLQGTGASAGLQLTDRVFGLYKFKVDETQNQRYFRDEVELIYRVTGNLHLRASTELDTEKFLGLPPNRQAILENQWRFGLPRRKSTEEKEAETSAGTGQ